MGNIYDRIRELRIKNDMTQEELARAQAAYQTTTREELKTIVDSLK